MVSCGFLCGMVAGLGCVAGGRPLERGDAGTGLGIGQGGGPDAGGPGGTPLAAPTSFTAEGLLTVTVRHPGGPILSDTARRHDFVLRVDPAGPTLLLGSWGSAVRVPARTGDGMTFEALEPVTARIVGGAYPTEAVYTRFAATVTADELVGRAEGTLNVAAGDMVFGYDVTLAASGRRDEVGPGFGDDRTEVDPLAPLSLLASEPLPTGTAKLVAGDQAVDLDPVAAPSAILIGFDKPMLALRYATSYDLVVVPGTDLAGNPGGPPFRVRTIERPPLVPENGFEDGFDSGNATVGGAGVIEERVLPPISGKRSVVVGPRNAASVAFGSGDLLTVRLAVQPGDRVVRVAIRPFGAFENVASTSCSLIQVATSGGPIVRLPLPANEAVTTPVAVGTPGSSQVWFGPVRTEEIGLPPGAASEVVFQAGGGPPSPGCAGPFLTSAAYLIDDLRVE
jgi:hypothetical protein